MGVLSIQLPGSPARMNGLGSRQATGRYSRLKKAFRRAARCLEGHYFPGALKSPPPLNTGRGL